jgi:hypothetical protein
MNNKELEIQRAEQAIMDRLPPIARTFIFNSKKVDETIEKYEALLMSCMNDNGTVNGELLGTILEHKFPKLAEWINIPKDNFYLKDEIGVLLDFIFGGNYYGK